MKITVSLCLTLAAVSTLLTGGCTHSHDAGPIVEVPSGTFVQKWFADLELRRNQVTAIDILGDMALVRTQSNLVYALGVDSGAIKWSSQVAPPDRQVGKPIMAGDKIVFPISSQLIIYSKLGKREKEIDLDREVRSGLFGEGEMVYLGFDYGTQGRLGRVSITVPYNPVRWELMAHGAVSAAPAVFQSVIYSASEDGNVYAVTEERLPIWSLPGNVFSIGSPIVADLKVDETGVYVAGTDSKLYALDRVSGKIRWQYFAGSSLTTSPTLTSDSVYQFVRGKGIVAMDKTGGAYNREPRWNAEWATRVVAADSQYVYLFGEDNAIVAVDKTTGKAEFKTARDDLNFAAGNNSGSVVAATRDGVILGVSPVKSRGVVGRVVMNTDSRHFGG